MKKRSMKGILALALIMFSGFIIPNLGLMAPAAGVGIAIGSAYFGAMAVASAAAGPVAWGLFGMITMWGL